MDAEKMAVERTAAEKPSDAAEPAAAEAAE